jgi:hypothetical protein
MSINSYEGLDIGGIDDYRVTESNIRPPSCRFEASRQDGEPSLFGKTIEDLRAEIDDRAIVDDDPGEYCDARR